MFLPGINTLHPSFSPSTDSMHVTPSPPCCCIFNVGVLLAPLVTVHQRGCHDIATWISREELYTLHSTALHCIALHCTAICCIVLHCLSPKPYPTPYVYHVTHLLVTHCSDVLSSPHAQQVWSVSVMTLTVLIHQVPFQCDH